MSEQKTLPLGSKHIAYDGHPPHVAGSYTSKEAADKIEPRRRSMKRRIAALFESRGRHGLTDDEIEWSLGMKHQTASARRRELELEHLIEKTTKRRRTRSTTGATAAVYRIIVALALLLVGCNSLAGPCPRIMPAVVVLVIDEGTPPLNIAAEGCTVIRLVDNEGNEIDRIESPDVIDGTCEVCK